MLVMGDLVVVLLGVGLRVVLEGGGVGYAHATLTLFVD